MRGDGRREPVPLRLLGRRAAARSDQVGSSTVWATVMVADTILSPFVTVSMLGAAVSAPASGRAAIVFAASSRLPDTV